MSGADLAYAATRHRPLCPQVVVSLSPKPETQSPTFKPGAQLSKNRTALSKPMPRNPKPKTQNPVFAMWMKHDSKLLCVGAATLRFGTQPVWLETHTVFWDSPEYFGTKVECSETHFDKFRCLFELTLCFCGGWGTERWRVWERTCG